MTAQEATQITANASATFPERFRQIAEYYIDQAAADGETEVTLSVEKIRDAESGGCEREGGSRKKDWFSDPALMDGLKAGLEADGFSCEYPLVDAGGNRGHDGGRGPKPSPGVMPGERPRPKREDKTRLRISWPATLPAPEPAPAEPSAPTEG